MALDLMLLQTYSASSQPGRHPPCSTAVALPGHGRPQVVIDGASVIRISVGGNRSAKRDRERAEHANNRQRQCEVNGQYATMPGLALIFSNRAICRCNRI